MIVFDIETRRHPDLKKNLGVDAKIARLDGLEVDDLKVIAEHEGVKLGNRKDPEKVLSCIVDHFERMVDKAALRIYGAEVACIGYADIVGGPVMVKAADDDCTEKQLIQRFIAALDVDAPRCMTGFNIRGFDLPMLRARCALLGLYWPSWMPATVREDRYETDYVFDAMDVLSEGSLDTWLRVSGLPPKTGKGSEVQDMTPEDTARYCADDVERERMLLQKVLRNVPKHQDLLEEVA
ncbi:MAG: hypothetical protein GY701_28855 [Sulfitobacter sp.]|nr:hypothetical protein [Sulfitobacter sp.]